MQRRTLTRSEALKHFPIYFYRVSEFLHLYRLQDFIVAKRSDLEAFVGVDGGQFADYMHTLDVALTGWLVSLVDRANGSLNVIDMWIVLHPEHASDILARTAKLEPHLKRLKKFRDNAGFHASVRVDHAAIREETFTPEVSNAVQEFFGLLNEMLMLEGDIWAEDSDAGLAVDRIREVARRPVRRHRSDA